MSVEFTVVDPDTRIFRCHLTNCSADLDRDYNQLKDLYFRCNFDNFRTFLSPTDSDTQLPSWEDFEIRWTYETKFSHLLGAKLFAITVMGVDESTGQKDAFVGEATVDLMTICTGPTDFSLRLMDGDCSIGRIWFNLTMLEVSEMCVTTEYVTVAGLPDKYLGALGEMKIRSEKRGTGRSRTSGLPDETGENSITFRNIEEHYFGTSVAALMEDEGLEFNIFVENMLNETIVGSGHFNFAQFMEGAVRTSNDESQTNTTDPSQVDLGLEHGNSVSIDFNIPLLDYDGSATEGSIRGRCKMVGLPIYVQMYGGRTVDGVVTEGRPYPGNHPMPPFMDEEGVKKAALV